MNILKQIFPRLITPAVVFVVVLLAALGQKVMMTSNSTASSRPTVIIEAEYPELT